MERISGKYNIYPERSLLNQVRKQNSTVEPKSIQNAATIPLETHQAYALSFGSSELFTQNDMPRLTKIQQDWAKRNSVDPDRLPPIEVGNLNEMLLNHQIARTNPKTNSIQVNPVKQLVNQLGVENTIHENVHGLLHNLRRAWARQNPDEVLQKIHNVVFSRVLTGESLPILSGIDIEKLPTHGIFAYEFMSPPQLSQKEREKVMEIANQITNDHVCNKGGFTQLSDKGEQLIAKSLTPHLDKYNEYKRYLELIGTEKSEIPNKMTEKMVEYLNAMFFRRDFMVAQLKTPNLPDLPKSLAKPLTEEETTLALASLSGHLSTQEGNIMQQLDPSGTMEMFQKSYFLSLEERFARQEEVNYKLQLVNENIEKFKKTSKNVSEDLLRQQTSLQNDANIMKLVDQLADKEQEIIAAEKDPQKMAHARQLGKEASSQVESLEKITKFFEHEDIQSLSLCRNENDIRELLKTRLPEDKHHIIEEFITINKELKQKLSLAEKAKRPENLLVNTPENNILKEQYHEILKQIKTLTPNSELTGLPKYLFENHEAFEKYAQKGDKLFIECTKQFLKTIK